MGCSQSTEGGGGGGGPRKGNRVQPAWSDDPEQVMQRRLQLEQKMEDHGLIAPEDRRPDATREAIMRGGGFGPTNSAPVRNSPARPQLQPSGSSSPWGGPPRPRAKPMGQPGLRSSSEGPAGPPGPRQSGPMGQPQQQQQSSSVLPPMPPGVSFAFSQQLTKSKDREGKVLTTPHEQYRVVKKISRGAQGKVKKFKSTRDGTEYAAKMVTRASLTKKRPGARNAESPMDILHREICIMGQLGRSSPYVVALHEVIDDPEQEYIYLITEFCAGGPVLAQSGARPLSESEARSHFSALVEGLLYCHSRGVIHRDVKPDNVLRVAKPGRERGRDTPTVKLIDFGVSSTFRVADLRRSASNSSGGGDADSMTNTAGTPMFFAPECVTSSADTGGYGGIGADTWAAGVTLYFMVFGHCPFVRPNSPPDFPVLPVRLGRELVVCAQRGKNQMETFAKIRSEPLCVPPQPHHSRRMFP